MAKNVKPQKKVYKKRSTRTRDLRTIELNGVSAVVVCGGSQNAHRISTNKTIEQDMAWGHLFDYSGEAPEEYPLLNKVIRPVSAYEARAFHEARRCGHTDVHRLKMWCVTYEEHQFWLIDKAAMEALFFDTPETWTRNRQGSVRVLKANLPSVSEVTS